MPKPERDKGIRGQREVTQAFEQAGFTIRNLSGEGDNLVVLAEYVLHIETKRQETIKIGLWSKQAEAEAPPGAMPIVVYRRSHEPWRASLSLDHLLMLLRGPVTGRG